MKTVRIYFDEDKVYRTLPVKDSTTADECIEMILERNKTSTSNSAIFVRTGKTERILNGKILF